MNKKYKELGITLISLVITIIVLLILAGVSIMALSGNNGILTKASEAKIQTILGAVKEKLKLEQIEKTTKAESFNVETLLADGKVLRTVKQKGEIYYMYYAIKTDAYEQMQGLGKGNIIDFKDVFLIDDNLNIKYISSDGKEYGDNVNDKILEDETDIRFTSKAFSEYVSRISGVTEEKMKFKWMKNLTTLTIADSAIDNLEDLVFFPNLITLDIGDTSFKNSPNITTLNGIENCTKLEKVCIYGGPDKEYGKLSLLSNLKAFLKWGGMDFDNIIDGLKLNSKLESFELQFANLENMSRISELRNLQYLTLANNKIKKVEGLDNMLKLKYINLVANQITQIDGLKNVKNLTNLYLSSNKIKDITSLSANVLLTKLDLTKNPEIDGNRSNYKGARLDSLNKIGEILDREGEINLDIDKLGLFTNYKKLNLSYQNLTTLDLLQGMTELNTLSLVGNQLTLEDEASQEILKSMTKLESLNLGFNKLKNITVVNNLNNLKNLYISGNQIDLKEIEDSISNLNSLTISTESLKTIENCDVNKITKLILISGDITEIPDLSKFTKLKELNISYNTQISNYNIISKLTSLEKLSLYQNNLHGKMIDFSKLKNLQNLNLRNNTLWDEDLENLKYLKNNVNLNIDLSQNSIIDATSLLELNSGTKINLTGNINLLQEFKDKLKSKFSNNVTF